MGWLGARARQVTGMREPSNQHGCCPVALDFHGVSSAQAPLGGMEGAQQASLLGGIHSRQSAICCQSLQRRRTAVRI